jgi:hypothetical protein
VITPPVQTKNAVWEPIKSALVSFFFSTWSVLVVVLGFAMAANQTDTFQHTLQFYQSHWWPLLLGLIVNPAPFYRARQGLIAARTSNSASNN